MVVTHKAALFGVNVHGIFGHKSDMLSFAHKNLGLDELSSITGMLNGAEGLCCVTSYGILIWARSIDDHEVFYHECLHAACEVMSYSGAPISYENQETLAYLQGDIATGLIKAHQRQVKRKQKQEAK